MAKIPRLRIQQWEKSLAVRIPAVVTSSANFRVDPEIEVTTDGIGVTVNPLGPHELTLAEKLGEFDPAMHGGEAMATGCVGAEE
jgi:antitoxin MazE